MPLHPDHEMPGEITFHGGLDTQSFAPKATPAEIRKERERLLREFRADKGGYVLCSSNGFMPGTPVENILAFYDIN